MQQFLAYLHHVESNVDFFQKDIVSSLFDYFEYRYELEEVKMAAVFDFYSSIHLYAAKSMVNHLFQYEFDEMC